MQVNALSNNLPQPALSVPPPSSLLSSVQGGGSDASQTSVQAQTKTTSAVMAVNQDQQDSSSVDNTKKQSVDDKTLNSAVNQLNEMAKSFNTQLQFSVDPTTGRRVIKVMDSATHEVIRQIPAESVLRLSKAIDDFKGLLVKESA